MKNSIRLVLILLFGVSLMTSCCDEETYEVTITGIESRPVKIENSQFVDVDEQNPIDKEDFVISVSLNENQVLVSNSPYQKKASKANIKEAAVVPCSDPVFININTIESVKVYILDSDNGNARIEVTNQVRIVGSNQTFIDYISENKQWLRDFLIQFSNTSNIPNRIEYEVEVTLDDSSVISSSGGIINFN